MPFGAEVMEDGGVRFALWAPAADRVDLCLRDEGRPLALPMTAGDDGWFELRTRRARAGSSYRYRIDGGPLVPDPAARFQPGDVHGDSEVIDPRAHAWRDGAWRGRAWEEAVIYELHVGAFTPAGTFAGAAEKLDHLRALGVTAVELMPVADFPGARNWGYDGVLLYAPDARYGRPEDLKALIDAAHARGMMVFLDVVYNHFGPEGNYLHGYAPQFFTERRHTPWGAAIDFDGAGSRTVREFYVHNALYWLDEYRFDGLRLDAVHAILDDSEPHILDEIAARVRARFDGERDVHLVLENDDNAARYLAPRARAGDGDAARGGHYDAQWNDDFHHAVHVLLTGETGGYYGDYADAPLRHLGRCLAQGFAWQGEPSPYRGNRPRGEASAGLAPTAFVDFIQNHDQVGNRACGERIETLAPPERLRAALAMLLLAPAPPLLFMGQEWACGQPFPFFCDFGPDLAERVASGRREEFARFPEFSDPARRARIPDPQDEQTFLAAVLDWSALERPAHARWLALHRELLSLRRRHIVPRLRGADPAGSGYSLHGGGVLRAHWTLGDGSRLELLANLADETAAAERPSLIPLYAIPAPGDADDDRGLLPPWSVRWYLSAPRR